MRWLRSLFVIALCVGFTPGLGELVSDGLHAITEGHTHHAEGHEPPDAEHGCTGWQHTCGCHVSLSIAPAVGGAAVAPAPAITVEQPQASDRRGPVGVRDGVERPPRA
ncbi:MAG: hypothetical protein OXT09_18765 [Myxococcales bacterium]|nr:hypothetical protein [Myxococcales bacterium]